MHSAVPERPAAAKLRWAMALAIVAALLAAVALQSTGVAQRLEDDTVDARFHARPAHVPGDVAVVGIDAESFSRLRAQWPWPRAWHARMVDILRRAGARVIAYDVQFTEQDRQHPAGDIALYDAVARARNVVLATTETTADGHTNVLGGDANLRAAHARAAAANFGIDTGEVTRRVPYALSHLDTMAVAAAGRALGRRVPRSWFTHGEAIIDYAGPSRTVPTYSFERVLHGHFPKDAFRGRVVVVGATAPSLQDVHATPASTRPMSGPEVQANAIRTVLHGVPLRPQSTRAQWIVVLLMGLAPGLLTLRLRLIPTLVGSAAVGLAFTAVAVWLFDHGLVVTMAAPLLALAAGTGFTTVARYVGEVRDRRRYAWLTQVLEARVAERTAELRATQREVVQRLGAAADSREAETGRHIERVGRLCEALALRVGFTPTEAETIRLAAALHDIGKIGIPDNVLLKEGPLTREEWEVMRQHTTIGGDILAGSETPLVRFAEQIARTHHECWDGTGYPAGLIGQEIPVSGRICAICDVFDALLSSRTYKRAWPLEAVLAELRELAGRQFDPDLVDAFARIAPGLYVELGYGDARTAPVPEAAPDALA
ncbi:MAG: CHASE2 domain-containing protein [Thermoleophilia bacterium]